MTNVDEETIEGAPRSWRRTIAAKLLAAFILIAALTAIAALVAVLQFGRIEAAMGRLTEESLPEVKFALAVESNARAIAADGARLAGATSEAQRFGRMNDATERVGQLWSALSRLRDATNDTAAIEKLQPLIAQLDGQIGQLERNVRERISVASALDIAIARLTRDSTELAERLLLLPRQSDQLQLVINGLRGDTYRGVGVLYRAATASDSKAVAAGQKQFDEIKERFEGGLNFMMADTSFDRAEAEAINKVARSVLALGSGAGGIFALRTSDLDERAAAEVLQTGTRKVGRRYADAGFGAGLPCRGCGRGDHCRDQERARQYPLLADRHFAPQPGGRRVRGMVLRAALCHRAAAATDGCHARRRKRAAQREAAADRHG